MGGLHSSILGSWEVRYIIKYQFQQKRMENSSNSSKRIELNPRDRIFIAGWCTFALLLYVYFQFFMAHYTFKSMPSLFQTSSLLDSPYKTPSYLYNGCLYALFFIQHVIMALIIFKVKASKIWTKFPLYERCIYNTVSSVLYILILRHARPLSGESEVLFTTPYWLNTPISYTIYTFQMCTLIRLTGIIFFPFSFKQIFNDKYIEVQQYSKQSDEEVVSTGMFAICRHPMQACTAIRFLTVSNLYTVDRVIFIVVNLIGIFVGVLFEESRLMRRYKGYKQYKKKVPYRFIPYII